MMRATLSVILIVGLTLPAPLVVAQDPGNKEQAQRAMREGNRLLARGQHADALAKFDEAHALYPSARLQFNRAQALQGIPGREVETLEALLTFLEDARTAPGELRSAAERESRKLRKQLALLRIDSVPPGATVVLDGREAGTTPTSRPQVLRPGRARLEVRHPGYDAFGPEEMTLVAGEELSRKVVLSKSSSAGPSPLSTQPTTPPPVTAGAAVGAPALLPSVQAGTTADGPELHARTEGAPFYKKGWFWVAVAGTVAATIAVGLLVARSGDPARRYECPPVPGMVACERLP